MTEKINNVRYPLSYSDRLLEYLASEIRATYSNWNKTNEGRLLGLSEALVKDANISKKNLDILILDLEEFELTELSSSSYPVIHYVVRRLRKELSFLHDEISKGRYEELEYFHSSGQRENTSDNEFSNPAIDPTKQEYFIRAKKQLLELASEVSLRNDTQDKELRDELVAFLKALLAFLGEGIGNPPNSVPKSIPENAKRIAQSLKQADSATGSAINIYEKILDILAHLF